MPTYVYECSSCNSVFEKEQRITEDPINSCDCGSTGTVRRVIQPVGIAFKGSGFHINDYSSKASSEASAPAAPAAETAPCTGNPSTCACSSDSTPSAT